MGARIDNTIAVIPSYNEAGTIGEIVQNIVRMGMSVLVIDDGSTDNTERIALDSGAMVIRHRHNLGKGFSVREGIRHVLEKTNFEWMIMMDGDGQHHTEDIPALMSAAQLEEADIVTGNRMLETKRMPVSRYWTNRFTSWVLSGMCKQSIPDTQCGYRLIRVSALKKLKLTSEKYDIESEILIQAAENNMRIKSVPIQTIYGEETSKIRPIRDTIRFFALVFRYHLK
ncbi:glycosyltransferase family 2 protein [Candidatus Omnitrophota bacterium]